MTSTVKPKTKPKAKPETATPEAPQLTEEQIMKLQHDEYKMRLTIVLAPTVTEHFLGSMEREMQVFAHSLDKDMAKEDRKQALATEDQRLVNQAFGMIQNWTRSLAAGFAMDSFPKLYPAPQADESSTDTKADERTGKEA